jgi:hypothetical protein
MASIRIRIDKNVKPDPEDERTMKTLAWLRSLPPRKVATIVWELIVQIVNGEVVGVSVKESGEFDVAAAEQAAEDLFDKWAG